MGLFCRVKLHGLTDRQSQAAPNVHGKYTGSFSFLYLKKLKFQKYMAISKIFKTIPLSPPAWATGGLSPTGWATGPKRKKKLHLGPGAQDALNSKLVKSI